MFSYNFRKSSPCPKRLGQSFDELREWFDEQFESREIEPNSSLGEAITYATNRWKELTLFLRVPGAPIDNNACCWRASENVEKSVNCGLCAVI